MGLQTRNIIFGTETFPHYYLCNYKPKSNGNDELSKSLLNFKKAWPLHVEAWISCSISEISNIELGAECVVLRVLGSNEEIVSDKQNTPMDRLGKGIAERYGIRYDPTVIRKNKRTQKIKLLSASEREQELDDAYIFLRSHLVAEAKEVFILDDILTTGATIRAVIKAIRAVSTSCKIRVFTLAHTDQDAIANKAVQFHSYPYSWEIGKGWNVVEESHVLYSELATLRRKILNDAFLE
jgi:hypothetical protein